MRVNFDTPINVLVVPQVTEEGVVIQERLEREFEHVILQEVVIRDDGIFARFQEIPREIKLFNSIPEGGLDFAKIKNRIQQRASRQG